MALEVSFGILTEALAFDLSGVSVSPSPGYADTVSWFTEQLNEDGFYYSPPSEKVSLPDWPDETRRVPVPRTKRPTHLFFLPASHTLRIETPISHDPLAGDASFIVQLLAFLYCTRLQLADLQFDGRIPVKRPPHQVWVGEAALQRFVPSAYSEWKAQPPERALRITSILYMYSRAPSYDWVWEQFLVEYLVTDALFDLCARSGLASQVGHEERIRELCGRLGIWCPPEAPVGQIVEMRHSLFHEALWEGERPGYRISANSYYRARDLRALNHRIIAAVLGSRTAYTSSRWSDCGQVLAVE